MAKYFREKRRWENLSQRELLKQEFIQIAWAIVAIIVIMGSAAKLHSLYVREYDAFHKVVSDIAPRFCRGPHALRVMQMFRVVFALVTEPETNC
jgi:hypothetical protein